MVIFHGYGTVYQRVTTLLGNWVAPADRSMIATQGRSIGDCGDCASLFTLLSTFVLLGATLAGWWFQPLWKILVTSDDYSQYMET